LELLQSLARAISTWHVTGASEAVVTVWIKLFIQNLLALSSILGFFAVFFLRVTTGCVQRSGIPTVDGDADFSGSINNLMREGSFVHISLVIPTWIITLIGIATLAIYI
jgi:hypothetical protein